MENGLPTKLNRKEQREMQKRDQFNLEPIHAGHGRTNIAKEMESCVLKNIELQENVAKVTDKKAAKLRKVSDVVESNNILDSVSVHICNMMTYSTAEK